MFLFGNLAFYIFWPLVTLQAVVKKTIRHPRVFFTLLFFTIGITVLNPSSAKYGLAFMAFVLFRLKLNRPERYSRLAILMILSCLLIEIFPRDLLFNPDNVGFRFWRYKAFFTEPAYLGYWSAYLAYELWRLNKFKQAFVFLVLLIMSSSVGAFLYFGLNFLYSGSKRVGILGVFLSIALFLLFKEQALAKAGADSLSRIYRIDNFLLTFRSIIESIGAPQGFGPLIIENKEVGVMSGLLFVKAFGFLLLPLYFILPHRLFRPIQAIFLFFMVGNFWETPFLWHFRKR